MNWLSKLFKNKETNRFFCTAPWVHAHSDTIGKRRLCCASEELKDIKACTTLEDYWNSDTLKDIRKKMLKGEYNETCRSCYDAADNEVTYQSFFNYRFKDKIKKIQKNTKRDGTYNYLPESLDYRFANTCNYKCRMCGEENSSSWAKETQDMGHPQRFDWPRVKEFASGPLYNEFKELIVNSDLREIYWAGGEPLFWNEHWELMNELVQSGKSKNVFLRYNTNLSKLKIGKKHFFDLLEQFKGVDIQASIDGEGKLAEYIRTGIEWQKWDQNFKETKEFADKHSNVSLFADVTITLPGLYGINEFISYLIKRQVKPLVKNTLFLNPGTHLSPLYLPKDLRNSLLFKVLYSLQDRISKEPKNEIYIKPFLAPINFLIESPCVSELFPDDYLYYRKYATQTQYDVAQFRKDGEEGRLSLFEILSETPEILSWWQENEKLYLSQKTKLKKRNPEKSLLL